MIAKVGGQYRIKLLSEQLKMSFSIASAEFSQKYSEWGEVNNQIIVIIAIEFTNRIHRVRLKDDLVSCWVIISADYLREVPNNTEVLSLCICPSEKLFNLGCQCGGI